MEAFYVQERLIELLMPDVHKAFVSRLTHSLLILSSRSHSSTERTLHFDLCLRYEMVHHPVRQLCTFRNSDETVGWLTSRRSRLFDRNCSRYHLAFPA